MISTREEALALALQRLRNAARDLMLALERNQEIGSALSEMESAVYCAHLDAPALLRWADEMVLSVPAKPRPYTSKAKRRLKELTKQAEKLGIRIAHVHDFGKKSFAVYRGPVKIGAAQTDRSLAVLLARAIRADRT